MSEKKSAVQTDGFYEKIYKDIRKKNEKRANSSLVSILLIISLAYLISQFINGIKILDSNDAVSSVFFIATTCFSFISIATALRFDCEAVGIKYMLMLSVELIAFAVTLYSVYGYLIFLALPVIASLIYSDFLFTAIFSIVTYIFFIMYVVLAPYFGSVGDYAVSTVLSNQISLLIIGSFAIIGISLIALLVALNSTRMLEQSAQDSAKMIEKERQLTATNERIMMSQLRPHFLYNCLTAIMAIDGNPPETVSAIGSFAKYLRTNLNSIESEGKITFDKELEHIKRYLSLEQLRFDERLKTEFDIRETAFEIPPLTVQMAVENAVVHGVSKKPEGGIIKLSAVKENCNFVIKVEDNGLGFDMTEYEKNSEGHVGIKNIRSRIKNTCDGSVSIESEPGKGTKVTIIIPEK